MLTDPEGAPVAALEVDRRLADRATAATASAARCAGWATAGTGRSSGCAVPRRRCAALLPPGRVLGVIADRPLHRPQLAQIAHAARTLAAHLLILIPVTGPGPDGLPPEALVRAIFAARDRMPPATIVAVPLMPRGDEMRDALLRARVAAAYGVTHVLSTGDMLSGGGLRVLVPRELAYDNRDGQWRWRDDIPPRNRRLAMTPAEIDDLLDRGFPLPEWHTPPAVAKELARVRPPRRHRGLVVFFTGCPAPASPRSPAAWPTRCGRPASAPSPCSTATWCAASCPPGWASARPTGTATCAGSAGSPPRWPGTAGMAVACPIAPYENARAAVRADGRGRPAPASCWCTWPPRSRCASSATARACTPRPGPASSRA